MSAPLASFRVQVLGAVPRKNRRHILVGTDDRPRPINSKEFGEFAERLDAAWRAAGHPVICHGRWRLLVESSWGRQRHLDVDVADGDVDAPLSCVLDAMQMKGLLDNDARVVELAAVKLHRHGDPRIVLTLEVCDG